MKHQRTPPKSPVLRRKEAAEYLGISIATLHRRMLEPGFPPPIKLGPNATGFFRAQIDEWLKSRINFETDDMRARSIQRAEHAVEWRKRKAASA